MRKIKLLALVVLGGVFIYSGINIGHYIYDGYTSIKINARLKQQYAAALQDQQAHNEQFNDNSNGDAQSPSQFYNQKELYQQRFDSLQEFNSDIVGWINIAGTRVDYPVVRHTDNDYYLNHNLEHARSSHGAIFMDYRNRHLEQDRHTVIYGHHMKDGSMFGALSDYKDEDYYEEHAIITLDGLEQSTQWQIFSVYVYMPEHQFFQFEFESEEEYDEYLHSIVAASSLDTGVEITTHDQLLTLVTCTYEVNDARFIVHAKRIV